MRCGACGAHNPDSAGWCSQCFTAFGQPESAPASDTPPTEPPGTSVEPERPETRGEPETTEPDAARPATAEPSRQGLADRDVREHEGEVQWRCTVCDGWSSLHEPACRRCGAARTGFGVDAPAPVGEDELDRLVALTVLLPGLGHVKAGRAGTGVARAVVALAWLLGAIALGIGAVRSGAAPVAAIPLLLGAIVVWVTSVRDVRVLAGDGRRELLDARGLLWLVAGVTGLLAVALLFDTMRLSG